MITCLGYDDRLFNFYGTRNKQNGQSTHLNVSVIIGNQATRIYQIIFETPESIMLVTLGVRMFTESSIVIDILTYAYNRSCAALNVNNYGIIMIIYFHNYGDHETTKRTI